MPLNAADAGRVDEALNELRQENENLRALVEAQGRQIDALNAAYDSQNAYINGFVDRYNAHTH